MKRPSADPAGQEWLQRAQRVSRRVNFAWWLEVLAAPLLVAAIAGAALLLLLRQQLPELGTGTLVAITAGTVVLLAIWAWWRAARKFETLEQSLVRLEAHMHLRNGLSAALAGVAPWPSPGQRGTTGLRWHWPRLLIPPLGALALLAAGLWIPISAKGVAEAPPPDEPQAWQRLDDQLDHLTKEEVVDEPYLEEMRKKLAELRAQEEQQWFSHSSLEATDSLRKAHRSEVDRLARELDRATNSLDALEKNPGAVGQQQQDGLLKEFDQALQGLQNGAMKPNPQLLEQMKQFDPKNLGQLNPEQLKQLRENLKKHADGMQESQNADGGGEDWSDELLADGEEGEEGNGERPGSGGINRGPGHSPGVLGKEREKLETGDLTGLDAKDLSNSLPGDLLQLQDGEHEADPSASTVTQGGGLETTGVGGERVWREALDPDEQRALKRFFE